MSTVLTPDETLQENQELPEQSTPAMAAEEPVEDAPMADSAPAVDESEAEGKEEKPKKTPAAKNKTATKTTKKTASKKAVKEKKTASAAPSPPKTSARPAPDRPDRILGADGEWVEDDELPVSDEMYQIAAAHNTHKIMTASLTGYEKQEGLKPVAVCYFGNVKVIIPISEMEIHLEIRDKDDYYNYIRYSQIIDSMIGAKIDFVVKGFDINNNLAVGSRKEAMERKRRTILNATQRDGTYRIYEEIVVEGRITNVHEKIARIEIFGFEARILPSQVFNTWITDMQTVMAPGDIVKCKIMKIERNQRDEVTRLEVSMRDLNLEQEKLALQAIHVGSRYVGTVMRRRGTLLFVRLNDTDVDVACELLGGMTADVPYIGTTVKVLITRKNPGGQLYGSITRVMSKSRPHMNR